MWKFSYYFSAIAKKISLIFQDKINKKQVILTPQEKSEKLRLYEKHFAYKSLSFQKRREIDEYIQKHYIKK